MRLPLKLLALTVIAIYCSVGSVGAATNQAVLNVTATVTNNCDVLTQPATLSMTYDPVLNIGPNATSSFTYACTNGASVSVTPTSPNHGYGSWDATNGAHIFAYWLYNDTGCATNQLTNGAAESLGSGTGSSQSYNICGRADTFGTSDYAGTYTDTVTFTFNFGP